MNELIIAAGLFLVLEGLVYGCFPNGVKKMAEEIQSIANETLRTFGLVSVIVGLLIIWFMLS